MPLRICKVFTKELTIKPVFYQCPPSVRLADKPPVKKKRSQLSLSLVFSLSLIVS